MIKFQCPSGHPLTAPESAAGKSGKCPKCNSPFVVPSPVEIGLELDPLDDQLPPITPAMGSGKGNVTGGEVFVFLCPNGHKLHGPPSLKGKAGQCPHCGARFRIPSDEDIELANQEGSSSEGDQPVEGLEDLGGNANHDQTGEGAGEYLRRPPAGPQGLGYIVGRLWDWRTQDTELEIFLSEGEIVAPDYYSEFLSTSDFGVFGIQASDGSYDITVIPWNTVRRVGMRRLPDLSGDVFQ